MNGVVTTLFVIVSSVVIARSLGPSLMGEYSYWIWVVGTLPMMFGFGLLPAALKFSAELLERGDRNLAASVVLALLKAQLGVSGTIAAVLLLIGFLSHSGAQATLSAMVAALVLLGGVAGILSSAIKGTMDYKFSTYLAVLLSVLQLALFLGVLKAGAGVPGLLMVMIGCAAVSLILSIRWYLRIYRPDGLPSIPSELRASIVRYCRSLTGLSLLDAVVWSRSEVFFLGLFARADQIAFYSLAYGIAGRLTMAATLITHPMLPALSGLYGKNEIQRMNQIYKAAVRYVAILTFPLALGGVLFAEPLMTLLYTEQYAGAAPALAVTAFSSLAGALALACSATLYAIGRPDFLVRLNIGLAIADILASVLLIPRYGATGAALANVIGPIATVAVASIFLQRRYGLQFPIWLTAKILAVASGAALFAWTLIPAAGIGSFLAVGVVGGGAYLLALLACRVFNQEEDRELFEKIGERLPAALRGYYARVVSALI